ncbi:MAG TPA: hypothetical protein DC061_15225, partial [Gemmobacter sp.]|nr:hypothetical protein [Gemmobacter sp.]
MTAAFNVEIIFKTQIAAAKAAVAELKGELGSIGAVTGQTTAVTDAHAAALVRDADAAKKAALAQQDLAAASKKAREEVAQATGATAPKMLPTAAPAMPRPANAPSGPASIVPPSLPVPAPAPVIPPGLSDQEKAALRARYLPMVAAEKHYQDELENLRKARKGGALSDAEASDVQDRLRIGYDRTVESIRRAEQATRGHTGTIKLQAHEQRNLMMQVNDTVQSLLLGMPPMQVFLQQGPQIVDAYGGVGRTLQAVRGALTGVRLVTAGTAAAVLIGLKAWNDYLASTKAVETAAAGLGRATAGSLEQMEAAALAGSSAAGISISAARQMEVAFLRTGKIGHENFARLIGISKDFGATVGLAAGDAGDALASMFADPAKAAEALSKQYGLLDAATVERARNLAAQNRVQEAQAVLIDGLTGKLADAEAATTALGRAWNSVATGASNAFDWMGRAIDRAVEGPTLDDARTNAAAEIERQSARPSWLANQSVLDQARVQMNAIRAAQGYMARDANYQRQRAAGEQRGRAAWDIAAGSPVISSAQRRQDLENSTAAMMSGLATGSGMSERQQGLTREVLDTQLRMLDALANKQARLAELDELDIRIQAERNPLLRAELEARRTRLQMADQEVSSTEIETAALRARNQVMGQALASAATQTADMRAEVDIRQRLTAQVAAGTVKAEDMNRLLQEELTLRPLIAAAAAAEGKEKTDLLSIIDQLRKAYFEQALSEKLARQASAMQDYTKSQGESMAMLQLELALLGQSEAVRARVLALYEAEKEIRETGATGSMAQKMRDEAVAGAELRQELERQTEAWDRVRQASEAAIDGPFDALLKGDFGGALESFANEAAGLLVELGARNPLKNAVLGTNQPTLADVGGISGVWDRLTGKAPTVNESQLAAQAASVASMTVTAGSVTISTTGLGQPANANFPHASNMPGMPLGGSPAVQSQIWSYFAGKGLKPHQIAGIMGNVAGESAFNPMAQGDFKNGAPTSFGLFQHHASRGQGLLDAVGGMQGLGDVRGQLDFVWKELMSTHRGAFDDLMGTQTTAEAADVWMRKFEIPSTDAMASSWPTRLASAETAMSQFEGAVATAGQGLGTLGTGFEGFGAMLGQALSGGGAGGGGLLGALASGFAGMIGIPGFAGGGWTGGHDPSQIAGVVHGREYVFDAAATARIGVPTLEAIRKGTAKGYQQGGHVSSLPVSWPTAPAAANGQPAVNFSPVINTVSSSGQPLPIERVEESTDARGQRQFRLVASETVALGLSAPGGKASKELRNRFGVTRAGL